ncbi:hypothetical protein MLD38_009982 [Melastoma candidum]|uniref:Uncharacterized protein n=1 Tax=Melastoma candidum TaxID=119954 RepID=A0ACB9QYC6_9MYRT|nr:hypothetical protein MLD38_009982 [Melastoma candidum]
MHFSMLIEQALWCGLAERGPHVFGMDLLWLEDGEGAARADRGLLLFVWVSLYFVSLPFSPYGIASFFQPRRFHCPRGSKTNKRIADVDDNDAELKDAEENGDKEEDKDDSSEDEEDSSEDEEDNSEDEDDNSEDEDDGDNGEEDIVMEEGNQEAEDDEGSSDDDDEDGYEDEYDEEAIQEGDYPDPTRLDLRQSELRVFVLLSSSSSL